MESNLKKTSSQEAVFELKAGNFTLPNLRLLSANLDALDEQLLARVQQVPGFFRNTPVVIDLSLVAEHDGDIDFALLVGLMRGYGMVPVAVQGGSAKHQEMAQFLELAVLSKSKDRKSAEPVPVARKRPEAKPTSAKLIDRPVRSGQRVYAAGRDLIILASVSSGAEVIADGNIHIYGALRGRALAGVKGNRDARIFCQKLHAELVAVAGQYRVSEQLEASRLGGAAQVMLSANKLLIEKL
ncbi:MAG: septum site-determining protein MinC [Pseudomonadota bacterium]